jgi:type I restriction enzyme S subunit
LEATAAAVFKSWFVDFDPVVAKSEGRKPFGMTDEIAALFPDRFAPNGLPEGWKPGKVRDLLTLSKQQCIPMNAGAEFFEHYSIPSFDAGQEPVLELGSSIKSNKFIVPSRCILVSKLNPATPRIWWPRESSPVPRICSTEFMVAVPRAGIPQSYCFALSSSADVNDQLCGLVTGTSNSHQRVKPDDFLDLPVSLPTGELLAAFDTVVGPLYARRILNQKQNRALRNLRDAILPGLVSGELQIKEVQREIAGVVG